MLWIVRLDEPLRITDTHAWAQQLVSVCQQELAAVLPFRENEREFLDRLLNDGEIVPTLLTNDEEMQQCIAQQPGLLWKAQNVRQHHGK